MIWCVKYNLNFVDILAITNYTLITCFKICTKNSKYTIQNITCHITIVTCDNFSIIDAFIMSRMENKITLVIELHVSHIKIFTLCVTYQMNCVACRRFKKTYSFMLLNMSFWDQDIFIFNDVTCYFKIYVTPHVSYFTGPCWHAANLLDWWVAWYLKFQIITNFPWK